MARYVLQAFNLTNTLKLKAIDPLFEERPKAESATQLIYQEGTESYWFVYRFGSVVFFNMPPERRTAIVDRIKRFIGRELDTVTSEEFAVEVDGAGKNEVGFSRAMLDALALEKINILALILAQSTALEYFEFKVDDMLQLVREIGDSFAGGRRRARSSRRIKRAIAQCIAAKQDLVGSLYLLDKPDATWEDPVLDQLHTDAADMFELKDRYRTIDYKLRMIQENLQLIAELLQHRQANFLEWVIIWLIAVEVVFFILDLFVIK